MDEASKQYTTFTMGNLGFFKCNRMPFGLCNTPATFQQLMQNCMGELNFIYCLIYLDDLIMFSQMAEEHLHRLHIVFDCLRGYNLRLKPLKCQSLLRGDKLFGSPSIKERCLAQWHQCKSHCMEYALPQTYTEIRSFLNLVGHYRQFIKGFAWIAQPLNEHLVWRGSQQEIGMSVFIQRGSWDIWSIKTSLHEQPSVSFCWLHQGFLTGNRLPWRRDWEQFFPRNKKMDGFTQ